MQTSRLRAALLVRLLLVAATLLLPHTLLAQAVTGVGDDATMPRGGELRFSILSVWKSWYERYGQGTPGRPNGSVEPLGVDFNFDTIGVGQLENLAPIQTSIRSLSGMPGFTASLGTSQVQVRDNVLSNPLALEMGLTNHLSLSVMVPFVTATSNVNFVMNPTGFEPTLGFNPTLIAPSAVATNASFLAQFDSASSQLIHAIALCGATPTRQRLRGNKRKPAGARALVTSANSFASGLAQVYGGRGGATGFLFVPIAGTAAQTAIDAKVSAFRAMYAGYGNTAITGTGPIAAQAPLTATDMQTVFTDSLFGVNAKPLATSVTRRDRRHRSRHEAEHLRFVPRQRQRAFRAEGLNFRQSFGGIYRFRDRYPSRSCGLHRRRNRHAHERDRSPQLHPTSCSAAISGFRSSAATRRSRRISYRCAFRTRRTR